MSTLVLHTFSLAVVSPGEAWVVLCASCASSRAAAGSPGLALLSLGVVSGCCHDCGGGWCMCRGALSCDLCPRRNSPVLLEGLSAYRLTFPPAPDTLPALEDVGEEES